MALTEKQVSQLLEYAYQTMAEEIQLEEAWRFANSRFPLPQAKRPRLDLTRLSILRSSMPYILNGESTVDFDNAIGRWRDFMTGAVIDIPRDSRVRWCTFDEAIRWNQMELRSNDYGGELLNTEE